MNWNPEWSSAVAVALLVAACLVTAGPVAADETATRSDSTPNGTADDETPVQTASETNRTVTEARTATETATTATATETTPTATERQTPTATSSPTETRTRTDDTRFAVSELAASDSLRAGDGLAVTATVTNRGAANGTETLRYSFGGETVATRSVTLEPGESTAVTFEVAFDDVEAALGSVEPGTFVHGVRNESGAGAAARVRVTPDVDLTVESVDAPTEVSHGDAYVVLATVGNPSETAVTRRVAYEFAGRTVAERAVTVAGDDDRQVAFEIRLADVERVAGPVRNETTYDHGIAAGDDRDVGAVRVVRSPSADASSLAVESFETVHDVRPGDAYTVELAVRNVDTADFEGQLSYRVDGNVVATEWARVPIGERRTVAFEVEYDAVADAAVPLSSAETEQGVFVGREAVATRPVAVSVPATPEATPRPEPTFTAAETPSPAPTTAGSDAADATNDGPDDCRRGFFTPCGGAAMGETSLTMVGILLSGFGIVYQMYQGRR